MVTADLIDTLSRVGAIGGILSIVGVGLLILLVAAQSRQIRSMKEWIEEEPQRQQETAQRVIAEVQRRIAAARERRSSGSTPPPPAVPRAKPAPGTLGATPEAQAIAAAQQGDVPVSVASEAGAPTEVSSTAPPGFLPATAAAGADLAFAPLTPAEEAESEEPAVVSEFLGQDTQLSDAIPPDELPPLAAASTRGDDIRFGEDHFDSGEEPPRSNRVLFGVGAAALVAGIVLAGVLLFGGGGDDTGSTGAAKAGRATPVVKRTTTPAASFDPSTVNVQVFNGTTVNQLAQRVTDALKGDGFATGAPETLGGGVSRTTTTVYYRQGQKTAATRVAQAIGLTSGAVQPISADISAPAGASTEVVVVAGTDQSTTPATSTTG